MTNTANSSWNWGVNGCQVGQLSSLNWGVNGCQVGQLSSWNWG